MSTSRATRPDGRGDSVPKQAPTRGRDPAQVGETQFGEKRPVRMLHDRVLVSLDADAGERRSTGGIVIPATAQMGKRLSWAEVVAVGGNVRSVQNGDRVLFDPEDRGEIELHGVNYILLRERDIHAVASERIQDGAPGLYI